LVFFYIQRAKITHKAMNDTRVERERQDGKDSEEKKKRKKAKKQVEYVHESHYKVSD
jgi:hypothetical protein